MKPVSENFFQYLLHLFDNPATVDIHEFLSHSTIEFEEGAYGEVSFHITVHPEIFKKHHGYLTQFENSIKYKSQIIAPDLRIKKISVFPDLEKFQIIANRIVPVYTPWEEINSDQNHLISLLRLAKETIDFQNIGNCARTLLQKIANTVFEEKKHVAEDPKVGLSEGQFKNRLHTYIKFELQGNTHKKFRDYAESVITTAEKSVDLANELTHDLNANSFMAESTVISTITVISIIKLISNKNF